jgi:hypothetical protein
MQSTILNKKPKRLWEWREYKNGSLVENGIALNKTATFIWKLCNGKRTVNQIILNVLQKYNIPEERAKKDVLDWIKILVEEKTIELG